MNKDLVDFFVKTEKREEDTFVKSLEDTNETATETKGEADSSENSSKIKLFLSSRSFGKHKILFDF